MSLERILPFSLLVVAGLASAAVTQAAPCDGLTATVSLRELPVGHSVCDSAVLLVHSLRALSSLQTKSEVFGCVADRAEPSPVFVRVQLDPRFAALSRMDGFDLGKRLLLMKDRHPAIARVDVCKDAVVARSR